MKKTILITGASSGLGEGMAFEFARRGYNLALCARRTENLLDIKRRINSEIEDCDISIQTLDVTNFNQVFDVFARLSEKLRSIDKVIVNAGIGGGAPIGKDGFNKNLKTIETNFLGAFAQSEAAAKIFRHQKFGHLIIISSMSSIRGMRGSMTAYASSKAAVSSMAEGLRLEFKKYPSVKVSTINPDYIKTEINSNTEKSLTPFIIDSEKGCKLIANAIEKEVEIAYVPWWPWVIISFFIKRLPLWMLYRVN